MKKFRLFLCCILFSLFICGNAFCNEKISVRSKNKSIFQQHLEWESSGLVKEYKLIIEVKKGDSYVEAFSISTKNTFYDVSLKPGLYRYCVCFYNALGQMAFKTDYKFFEIQEAQKPELKKKLVESVYKQEDNFNGEFCITVKDASENSKYTLVMLGKDEKKIEASKVRIEGDKVYLTFPEDIFVSGNYKVVITNPGGLTASTGVIRIREKKDIFYDASFGYCPEFVLYDDFIREYFKTSFVPLDFYADFSMSVELEKIGRLGGGLIINGSPLWKKFDNRTLKCGLTSVCANFVYSREVFSVKNIPVYAEAFAGAGINILGDLHYSFSDKRESNSLTSILPCFDAGVSLKAFVTENIFVKSGAMFFAAEDFGLSDYDIGSLNIFAGVGVEL